MAKFIILLSCIVLSISVSAETVYKKVNSDGSVEFTDKNLVDSEEIKIRKTSTYSAQRLPSLALPSKKSSQTFIYALSISKPTKDSTIVGKADVQVTVFTKPLLKKGRGHQIRYELAGKSMISQNSVETFMNVDRGTHNLTVRIVDKNNDVISPVVSRTFHMKRSFKKPKS